MRPVSLLMFLLPAIPISLYDLREKKIPNALLLIGFLISLWCASRSDGLGLLDRLLGTALGFLFLWCIWYLTRGKIGLGDVKYASLIGAFAGVAGLFAAIFAASVAGLVFALVLIGVDRRNLKARIPFGPFLSFGGAAALVMQITGWPAFFFGGFH